MKKLKAKTKQHLDKKNRTQAKRNKLRKIQVAKKNALYQKQLKQMQKGLFQLNNEFTPVNSTSILEGPDVDITDEVEELQDDTTIKL